jgi:nitrile hydratase accessory protein
MRASEPVFEAPWHAQVFALTVHLHAQAAFGWPEWTEQFGAVLAEHGVDKELDGGEDYFLAWVEALERICTTHGLAEAEVLAQLKDGWARAYLATPHGAVVRLEAGETA